MKLNYIGPDQTELDGKIASVEVGETLDRTEVGLDSCRLDCIRLDEIGVDGVRSGQIETFYQIDQAGLDIH